MLTPLGFHSNKFCLYLYALSRLNWLKNLQNVWKKETEVYILQMEQIHSPKKFSLSELTQNFENPEILFYQHRPK